MNTTQEFGLKFNTSRNAQSEYGHYIHNFKMGFHHIQFYPNKDDGKHGTLVYSSADYPNWWIDGYKAACQAHYDKIRDKELSQ